jgi:hypothetical protein
LIKPRLSAKALFALLLLAVSVLGFVAYQMLAEPNAESAVISLAARIPAAPRPFDAARELVEENSIHRVNDEFRELRDRKGFAAAVAARAEGKRDTPVPMECSSRSNLLGAILRAKGYRTRSVSLFDAESTKSHTVVDVLNPDTGRWESQDPDYGFYWRSRSSQKRVSLADAAENLDDLEPCRDEVCGWETRGQRGGLGPPRSRPSWTS